MRLRTASGLAATLGFAMASLLITSPASAQVSGCEPLQKLLTTRQSMVAKITAAQKAKRKMTPQEACSTFGTLVNNGNETIKFASANKDWCQIPDEFMNNMKSQAAQAEKVRGQACGIAAKQAKEIARMRAMQQRQAGGPSGLPGSGVKLPNGAL